MAAQHGRRHRDGRADDDAGFSLVETVVSVALFAIVLLGTAVGATNVLFSSVAAREHSVATGLASQAASEAEALPFSTLQAGVYPPDLQGDKNVTSTGGNYYLTLTGAPIAACAGSTSDPPLVPHVTTVVLGVPYHVAAYPTVANPTCGSQTNLVTLVVVVSWAPPSGGTSRVTATVGIAAP